MIENISVENMNAATVGCDVTGDKTTVNSRRKYSPPVLHRLSEQIRGKNGAPSEFTTVAGNMKGS